MVNIPKNKISEKLEEAVLQKLLKEIKACGSAKGLGNIFRKILTKQEKEIILRRLTILEFVNQKKTYRKIKELLGMSANTISGAKDILLGFDYNSREKKKRYSSTERRSSKSSKHGKSKYSVRSSKFFFK